MPNFGDPHARILLVGLAPAAHGANRTGRMFTGDRSGDFLFAALHAAGLASQPHGRAPGDGLQLHDLLITAALHCAPPQNKPTSEELKRCRPWLNETVRRMEGPRVVVCLGRIAHEAVLALGVERDWLRRKSAFPFSHGAEHHPGPNAPALLGAYHPSQQNTFTGRLTPDMLKRVFRRAAHLSVRPQPPA